MGYSVFAFKVEPFPLTLHRTSSVQDVWNIQWMHAFSFRPHSDPVSCIQICADWIEIKWRCTAVCVSLTSETLGSPSRTSLRSFRR